MRTDDYHEKTLVFCTAFAYARRDGFYSWDVRYRIWTEAIKRSTLNYDQILLVDDGSSILPDWDDVRILNEGDDILCSAKLVLYHFRQNLGRKAISDFPGWVRSFFFVSKYAAENGFNRIIHLESDAFLITKRAYDSINNIKNDWAAFWCPRFERPESGIQVIAGEALKVYNEWAKKSIGEFSGLVIEDTLPFTSIISNLVGDRYGEFDPRTVPRQADWCMQASPPTKYTTYVGFYWWLSWLADEFPYVEENSQGARQYSVQGPALVHEGMHYLDFLTAVEGALTPSCYLEIGTHAGDSLKRISCDAICIDPKFAIASDVLLNRKNTYFFQGQSNDFFSDNELAERLLPKGVDLVFLDGLHLFEALLQDFINTERFSNSRSVILLHDCFPLNERMAERERRQGGIDESPEVRDFWTGDVWKVVLALNKYRPDVRMTFVDCPPTGLVLCTNVDRGNNVLSSRYDEIVADFSEISLASYGLQKLWQLRSMSSAESLFSGPNILRQTIFDNPTIEK